MMERKIFCTIASVTNTYEINISREALTQQIPYITSLGRRFAIISDEHTASLFGETLSNSLTAQGAESFLFTFPPGEHNKTRETKEYLENRLFDAGLGRDTTLIALGGGVVTDIAGYVAATYCRGIPLLMIPTTLLGMVDASIGGKNGVNVPYGKNMLGCVYQPKKVIIDPLTLQTLPQKELLNGIVEMIKHGLIFDAAYFDFLESHVDELLSKDIGMLEEVIYGSCRIKKMIVEKDEKEGGIRHLLNFGHTVGHALEKMSEYTLTHGEGVALGILVESYLCCLLGILNPNSLVRIRALFAKFGLPMKCPDYPIHNIISSMSLDKKAVNGQPRFVCIDAIGSGCTFDGNYCTVIEGPLIGKALLWMYDDLCVN